MPIVFRYLYTFFQNIFGRKRVEQELSSYLALVAAEKVRGGMAPEEALRAARQDLGGIEQVKENVRDIRIGAFMDTLMQDLRYALRTLARNPVFSSVVVLTLALGIGANTTIFTVVNGVLLKPLPYPEPERLLMLWETQLSNGTLGTVAPANFYDWRSQSHSFEKMAAIDPYPDFILSGAGEPQRLAGAAVSSGFFTMLGVRMALGRDFLAEEDRLGHSQAIVLSNSAWQRYFGARPDVVGRPVTLKTGKTFHLEDAPYTIQRGSGAQPELVYVNYSCIPVAGSDGTPEMLQKSVMSRDILH
jgi:putative ABC transport system permease protein